VSYLSYSENMNENLLMFLLRDHKKYMPIVEFFDNATQGLDELTQGDAELIASEVSQANGSAFCNGIRRGMTEALDADHRDFQKEKLAAILAFALKLNLDATSIQKSDIETVLKAGWSEQTVEDVVGLVAVQNLYNIIASGLGFKALPETVFAEIGKETVQKGSYAASFRAFLE